MQQIFAILAFTALPASSLARLTAFESGKLGQNRCSGRCAGVGENGLAVSGSNVVDVFKKGFAPVTINGS